MIKTTHQEQRLWLPNPPSLNSMFRNSMAGDRRGGRIKTEEYERWCRQAQQELMAQKAMKYEAPVIISMFFGERSVLADISNFIKPIEDALVTYGIIHDDNSKYVKGFDKIAWVPRYHGCVIHLRLWRDSEPLYENFDVGVLGNQQAASQVSLGMHPRAAGRFAKLKKR
ncbi:MAG TPA: hypothetical protein VFM24_03260 [Nitrospira sp.]|nr:hypothetical protein [Nitrospira sp.]